MDRQVIGPPRHARMNRSLMDFVLHRSQSVGRLQLGLVHMRNVQIRSAVFAGDSKGGVDVFAQFRRSIVTFWTTH